LDEATGIPLAKDYGEMIASSLRAVLPLQEKSALIL
jgi:hypothetical protein